MKPPSRWIDPGYSKRRTNRTAAKLKIDRGFGRDLPDDPGDTEIVKARIHDRIGRALGLVTMAERLSDEAWVRFLRTHGCDALQVLYARPMSAVALSGWRDR